MDRDAALDVLRRHRPLLASRHVARAAVFGSVARGESGPDSDLDILIEFEPDARVSVYQYVAVKEMIAGLFDGEVDVVARKNLNRHIRAEVEREAIYAF